MRKLTLIFSLLLLLCLPVAAKAATLSGVGEVDLDPAITLSDSTDKKGNLIYNFRVNDGSVWHGASLFAPTSIPSSKGLANSFKLTALLDKMITVKFSHDSAFLAVDKVKLLPVGNKEVASANIKMSSPDFGFMVVNMNLILINTPDDVKVLIFVCADSDTTYWQPLLNKILSAMP